MIYKQKDKNIWINTETNEEFSTELYRGQHGKSFNFQSPSGIFQTCSNGMMHFLNFFNRARIPVPRFTSNNEVILSDHKNDLKDKKVLVLGGGPSSLEVEWVGKYDYVITSNNYFKKFSETPYMISLTPYMPLLNKDLQAFLDSSNCFIGIEPEFLKPHEEKMVKEFYQKYKNRIVFNHTRYCSTLGVGARQVVLALLLGASEVHMCGLDLFDSKSMKRHSFEDSKDIPRWRHLGDEFQNRQIIAFWSYVSKVAKNNGSKIINLAEDLDYNCLSFMSKNYEVLQ